MRRKQPNTCGYRGFECIGIKHTVLESPFYAWCRTHVKEENPQDEEIDPFINLSFGYLPTSFQGFTTVVDHVLRMDRHTPVPELDCIDNLNLFPILGYFMDLLSTYHDIVDARGCWHEIGTGSEEDIECLPNGCGNARLGWRLVEDSAHPLRKICFYTSSKAEAADAAGNIDPEGEPIDESDWSKDDSDTDTTYTDCMFEPGPLEPMLVADFDPVSIEVNTAIDAALDGAMLGIVQLTQWRIAIEKRIVNLEQAVGHLWAARNLFLQLATESACNQFKITKSGGGAMVQWGFGAGNNPPKFSVGGGTAMVNGHGIGVEGISNLSDTFYVYCNFYLKNCDNDTGKYSTVEAKLETSRGGAYSLGIGCVRRKQTGGSGSVPKYVMWSIFQERCTVSIELVRTCKSGVLFRTSGTVPYEIKTTAPCNLDDCPEE